MYVKFEVGMRWHGLGAGVWLMAGKTWYEWASELASLQTKRAVFYAAAMLAQG